MRIDKISITNFKLFASREFSFHPNFNLIVGTNGSGKTSVLRAVATALGGWAHAYIKNAQNLRPIDDNEIREIQREQRFDKSKSVLIQASGRAGIIDRFNKYKHVDVLWKRKREEGSNKTLTNGTVDYGTGRNYPLNFSQLGHDILTWIETGNQFDLPVIAFYECDRLWLPKSEILAENSVSTKYSRFDPYIDCFHTGADHKSLGEWLQKYELAALQKQEDIPNLQSIREAAKAALEGCTNLLFDISESRVMAEFADGRRIPFEHLSDGQRTMLSLFCDIARRAALLNPHFAGEASAKTAGVVLIDELDLHLHPNWQRRIIESLRLTFPKIQFICTTHSPFLIQSLRSGEELIVLDGEATADVRNLGIEQIAAGIMGVDDPQVSPEYMRMLGCAKEYLAELDTAAKSPPERLEAFKQQLSSRLAPFADNPAFQAVLEAERIVKLGA